MKYKDLEEGDLEEPDWKFALRGRLFPPLSTVKTGANYVRTARPCKRILLDLLTLK